MRKSIPVVVAVLCLLALSAVYADHPYSADRGSNTKSYYGERQYQESPGFVPSPRPVRYSSRERRHTYRYESHPYSSRYDDRFRYRPRVMVREYYYPRTLFPYGIRPFGYDSIGTRPPIYYDYRPGYRYDSYGHYCRPGAVLRYENRDAGLTIIIRP